MNVTTQIKEKIEKDFKPEHFEIINQSDKHIGHAGHDGSGESHFKLIVVSRVFCGYNRIQRHRMVNKALETLLPSKIHALSLSLHTPSEYK